MSAEILRDIIGGLVLLAIGAFVWWITGPMPGDKQGDRE